MVKALYSLMAGLVGALAVAAGAALYRRVAFRRDDEPAVE